jgi:hypothetical protein
MFKDAGHFIEDLGGPLGALDLGEGSRQFIDLGDVSSISLLGSLAQTLAVLPARGLVRLGKGFLTGAFDGLKQLGSDFRFGDVASLLAEPLEIPMLAGAQPPDAAADEDEEDKDNGEGAEDFILPEVEGLAQLGQFIAEALDLEL